MDTPLPDRALLVPVDFSAESQIALRAADAMVAGGRGTLTILHVQSITEIQVLDFTYIEPPERIMAARTAAEEALARLKRGLATPAERVTIEVVIGDPVEQIAARSEEHDLVVMATHERTGLRHFVLGSVAERVVRSARCSVLVVKDRD
ncbi:MAG: universal stress protein [Myxococcales bacterium]|nr:universal stress protein [Myxococcales bacterium]